MRGPEGFDTSTQNNGEQSRSPIELVKKIMATEGNDYIVCN